MLIFRCRAQSVEETKPIETLERQKRQLQASQTINIDVVPTERSDKRRGSDLSTLGQSETVRVNLPPSKVGQESEEELSDAGYYGYSDSAVTMMDKAEDVLRLRIRDLEKLEKHLKQQVCEQKLFLDYQYYNTMHFMV